MCIYMYAYTHMYVYRNEEVKGRNDVKIWLLRLFLKKVKFVLYVAFIVAYFVTGAYLKAAHLEAATLNLRSDHTERVSAMMKDAAINKE